MPKIKKNKIGQCTKIFIYRDLNHLLPMGWLYGVRAVNRSLMGWRRFMYVPQRSSMAWIGTPSDQVLAQTL